MKPKTMVLILMAVACGLGASFMTSRLLSERAADEEKVEVLVAKKNLDTGLIMKRPEELFEPKLKAKDEVPPKAISDLKELKGRCLRIPRRQGDMITQDELMDSTGGVSHNLPEGYRAVGQRVNMEATAAGFATLPLSRVDIIHTIRRGSPKDTVAQVLLENVLVLAADTQTIRDEGGKAMPASVVTFALTPQDALKLDLARHSGTISLALRKYGENTRVGDLKLTEDVALRNGKASSGTSAEQDAQDAAAAKQTNPAANGLNFDIGSGKGPAAVIEPKKERDHILVIVQGGERRKVAFHRNEEGQYEDPSERAADNAEANEEPESPPAARPPERKK